jgi:hypothetical protein
VGEELLHLVERFLSLRYGLVGRPLFGGHRYRNRLAEFMLHMEEVRRVMDAKVMFDIRQQPWCLVTR